MTLRPLHHGQKSWQFSTNILKSYSFSSLHVCVQHFSISEIKCCMVLHSSAGQHHAPFMKHHHLAIFAHFCTWTSKEQMKRAGAGSTTEAESKEQIFQPPVNIVPPLTGFSLCWPRLNNPSQPTSNTTGLVTSSHRAESQHIFLQAIFVPFATEHPDRVTDDEVNGLQEREVLSILQPLLQNPYIPKVCSTD